MKVSLCRWNDPQGSSRGVWLVKEVPGMVLLRESSPAGWRYAFSPAARSPEWARENPRLYSSVYYQGFRKGDRQKFPLAAWLLDKDSLSSTFPSRSQAVIQLEEELTEVSKTSLSEALSR